jgi:hypothetical protein
MGYKFINVTRIILLREYYASQKTTRSYENSELNTLACPAYAVPKLSSASMKSDIKYFIT